MTEAKYNLLLGASLESDNRGVNALGIGAVTFLKSNFPNHDIVILQTAAVEHIATGRVCLAGTTVNVAINYFPGRHLLRAFFRVILYRLTGWKPSGAIYELFILADKIYDLNDGDSFSDIYGLRRIIRHFLDSGLAVLARKELVLLPQTIGPFQTFIGRRLAGFVLKRAHRIYSRDADGSAVLEQLALPYHRADDLASMMAPRKTDIVLSENCIGINVSGLLYFRSYGVAEEGFENYKEILNSIMESLLKQDYRLVCVPHTYNVRLPNREDDLAATRDMLGNQIDPRIMIIDRELDAQELKYVIGKTAFFIGSRMHACIAALSQSVPTVGLAYSIKFQGTFRRFGQEQAVIDMAYAGRDKIGQIAYRINALLDKRNIIRHELEKANSERKILKLD